MGRGRESGEGEEGYWGEMHGGKREVEGGGERGYRE